ncbi:uncharacterized protein LOC135166001 [Diachasmimorpha longicaudata]|uniref:uncharacterized protein LOC135166001 n=1 Tax=Diachasmimorpha longicaudata TaxID=58733 RepID=UPI0030B8BE9F
MSGEGIMQILNAESTVNQNLPRNFAELRTDACGSEKIFCSCFHLLQQRKGKGQNADGIAVLSGPRKNTPSRRRSYRGASHWQIPRIFGLYAGKISTLRFTTRGRGGVHQVRYRLKQPHSCSLEWQFHPGEQVGKGEVLHGKSTLRRNREVSRQLFIRVKRLMEHKSTPLREMFC